MLVQFYSRCSRIEIFEMSHKKKPLVMTPHNCLRDHQDVFWQMRDEPFWGFQSALVFHIGTLLWMPFLLMLNFNLNRIVLQMLFFYDFLEESMMHSWNNNNNNNFDTRSPLLHASSICGSLSLKISITLILTVVLIYS